MFKLEASIKRLLLACPLAAAALAAAAPAAGQIQALKNADDQFIQGLKDQGMSELLDRFVQTDPPEDPIAKLALDVALKGFVAEDLIKRADQANQAGLASGDQAKFQEAIDLFAQSRKTYEQLLDAQRQLIKENPEDERLPLWQTDLAEMLIDRYLPRYYQNVAWHYEFGQPDAEQKAAFERAMTDAWVETAKANGALELLINRVGADAQLRPKLEEMGIWWTLDRYRTINTPYWMGHAAHGVSLLPKQAAYYQNKQMAPGQKNDYESERMRLRDKVIDAFVGALSTDDRTKSTALRLSGQTLIWSKDIDDIEDGIESLEKVMAAERDTHQGYLATLAKAVGRWNAEEVSVAVSILEGMGRHGYVEARLRARDIVPRLLAADLLFRILNDEALKGPAGERKKKIAEAYEKAYVPLLANNQDPRFRSVLFERWAKMVDEDADPAQYPPAVRMGIGEQLTQIGGAEAQALVQRMTTQAPPNIPAERERWDAKNQAQAESAKTTLGRAVKFNQTLDGEGISSAILARGMFNLGGNLYWMAEVDKVMNGGNLPWQRHFEAARVWLQIPLRADDAEQAEEAGGYAINIVFFMDMFLNKDGIAESEVRSVYKQAFEVMHELWPTNPSVHNNRLYAAFNLFERTGDLEQAIKVYDGLPRDHNDYFQARRQMLYAMHRDYRRKADKLRLMEATEPPRDADPGADAEAVQALHEEQALWQREHDALKVEINRLREAIIEEADIVILDAEDEVGQGPPARRFTAATALGAAKVVLAGMQADQGEADEALKLLDGFEARHNPDMGPLAQLAAVQQDPEAAKATLRGLIQSAQEQRIITLLEAGNTDEMAEQAKEMMASWPDVAAAVVNGVLGRLKAQIEREQRAVEQAAFERQKQEAREKIKFFANAAVALSDLLVQWAKGQGFSDQKMVAYQLPLTEALMLAGRPNDAIGILEPLAKQYPTNLTILQKFGVANRMAYAKTRSPDHYNASMQSFIKIITFYNQRLEKPAPFWDAWVEAMILMDTAGGKQAEVIKERANMLLGLDPDLGGPLFKERFMELFIKNDWKPKVIDEDTGAERVEPQPSSGSSSTMLTPIQQATPSRILPLMVIGVTGLVLLIILITKPLMRRPSR